jgi:hypothetical protein
LKALNSYMIFRKGSPKQVYGDNIYDNIQCP